VVKETESSEEYFVEYTKPCRKYKRIWEAFHCLMIAIWSRAEKTDPPMEYRG
jgi:hypothetical protein